MDEKCFFRKFVDFLIAVHQMTHEITKDITSDDLTPAQFKILQFIGVNQPVTLSHISECLGLSMPNTSRELKKLSEKKMCEKIADGDDRRKQYIRLSEDGEVIMNETFKLVEASFYQRIKETSDEELDEIERALDVLQTKVFYTQR